MTNYPFPSRSKLSSISLPWAITAFYLITFLMLPLAALTSKSLTVGWEEFWQIATDKIALSAYNVTFITALLASLINGLMGTLVAWVLVRYEFTGKNS